MAKFNLYGPINTLGYGIFTRGIIKGLMDNAEFDFSLNPIGQIQLENTDQTELQLLKEQAQAKTWTKNTVSLAVWHEHQLQNIGGQKVIAFPIFETDNFTPQAKAQLEQMDAIAVASHWAKGVVEKSLDKKVPVYVIPGASDNFPASSTIEEEPKSDVFTFLHIGKLERRKSHEDLFEAYRLAFKDSPVDTRFIMHCFNPFRKDFPQLMRKTLQQKGYEVVETTNSACVVGVCGNAILEIPITRVPRASIHNLLKRSHVGLYPSRAEGWNLPLMEGIKAGLPSIATNYSAHTEYLNEETEYPKELLLNKLTLERAYDGVFFMGDRGNWMKPSVEELSEKMVDVQKNYGDIKDKFESSRKKILEQFTWSNTASKISEMVEEVAG